VPHGRKDVTVRVGRNKIVYEEGNLNVVRTDEDATEEFVARVRAGATDFPADLLEQVADTLDDGGDDDRRKEIVKLRRQALKNAEKGRKREQKEVDEAEEYVNEMAAAKANEGVIYTEPSFLANEIPMTSPAVGVPEQGPATPAAAEASENPEAAQHNAQQGEPATDAQQEKAEQVAAKRR
jgi:hypothetical protein